MIRILCQVTDIGAAANIGGPVQDRYKTFDVDLPEVEEWINKEGQWETRLVNVYFIGVE